MNRYEKLTLLGVLHYVAAGLTALFGCFPLLYVAIGVMMFVESRGPAAGPNEPPAWFGLLFAAMGVVGSVISWAMAAAIGTCGYYLRTHRNHTFCVVVAAIECLSVPLGTILGVFTIVTLVDPEVKALFARGPSVGGPEAERDG